MDLLSLTWLWNTPHEQFELSCNWISFVGSKAWDMGNPYIAFLAAGACTLPIAVTVNSV